VSAERGAATPGPGAEAPEPAVVEFRVSGVVGELSMAGFQGFASVVEPVSTTLRGPVRDEAELADLVRRVRDAGLDLVSFRVTEGSLPDDDEEAP
jgi:hypothetical protein